MKKNSKKNPIEFFGAGREFRKHRTEFMKVMERSVSGGQFLQGKEVVAFENTVAKMGRRQYGVAVNSCSDALFFALVAAGIKPGDEVLVTDFSFVASASCITRLGAVPVFVDVDDHFLTDLKKAANLITPKTKAFIWVHLYGQMGNPTLIEEFSKKNNLILIEDAAQSIGAEWKGRPAGSLGLASCISFDPTKPIAAPGSGGVLLTDDAKLAEHVRRLRYHGRGADKTRFDELGFNSQMSTMTAALLFGKLKLNHKWLTRRRAIAKLFTEGLAGLPGLHLPKELFPQSHIFHKFVIRHAKRDALQAHLKKNLIESMVHYAKPLHVQPCFSSSLTSGEFPNTTRFTREVLSLPIHPYLADAEVKRIISVVREFEKSGV